MAMLKLNKLHLHLVDGNGWRLEIKKISPIKRRSEPGVLPAKAISPNAKMLSQKNQHL